MMYALALCHTIVVEERNGVKKFNASSPDELALVNGAIFLDYQFIDRDSSGKIFMEHKGKQETY